MEVPGPDNDWKSPQFRQKVVAQIDEEMRKAGTAHNKSPTDMENHVFIKAKSRDEYLSLVARLIIHFRDIHKKTLGGPVGGPGQMPVQQMVQAAAAAAAAEAAATTTTAAEATVHPVPAGPAAAERCHPAAVPGCDGETEAF